jgi:Zn-dependent peptidase ImmA (M78 family)
MATVAIRTEMLVWARERAALTVDDLAAKQPLKRLPLWERGKAQPMFKQLEAFAKATHVPIGYLFLPEPPDEPLPIPDFRTVAGAVPRRPSPDLLDTIYTMQRRQAWFHETLASGEADPAGFVGSARLSDDPEAVGREMRRITGLTDGWARGLRTWREALSRLRRSLEQLRVMAVINGIVGNNPHRPLDVDEFRGFALSDPLAPLIFVNGADAKSAQMFTLAHELAHLWLGLGGVSGFDTLLPGGRDVEDWCNRAAAEFLVPAAEMEEAWRASTRDREAFRTLAGRFKVSPIVVARRALDLRLVDRETFFAFYRTYTRQERSAGAKSDGGDFYGNQNTRVGELFATHVVRAALEGRVGFKDAYDLTGLRGRAFQQYAERLGFAPW